VADQPGFPIVFTPRNQNGRAPWVVVQRVTFRNNIVRHTAGGVNILGIDSPNPSERANNIIIRNNVFDDLTASVWGVSRVFQLGAGPDAVTIDHNLMVSTQSTMYWLYGGSALAPTPITNLAITNNMSPHNSFGLNGNNFSPGLKTFNAYMLPTGTFCNNVLAGGNTNAYPSATFGCDNFFPTVVEWQGDFVNYAAGDYHLLPAGRIGMPAQPPAGPDLGPDVDVVLAETTPALSGDIRLRSGFPAVRILTTSLPNGKYGEAYYQRVLCTPGYGPCAWEVLDSSMPAGLVFDAASGVISGTPSEAATGSLTLRAYDTAWGYNDATAILPITVDPLDFMIIVPEIPAAKVGEPFRLAPTVSGAMGSVTWTIVSGDLPAGITLDAFSGLIAGTPTMWGTSSALLQAQDSSRMDRTDAKTVTITVAPAAIEIPVSALPAGVYQSRYEAVLSATGGTGSYTWSVVGGAVPSGVIVDAGGLVSGEPQRVGLFTFSVQATDGKWPGYTATATVSLEVMPTPFSVSIPPVPAGVVGSPYALTVAATGQVGSVAWSIASGQLPPGLTIDASGTISGVPTTFGVFTAVVQARDSYTAFRGVDVSVSRTAAVNVTIVIAPLPLNVTTTTLPAASIPQPYRVTLQFTGGTGNTTWTLVGGKLPDGLTLSSDGVVAGRPTVVGEFSFTVQASDVGWAGNVTTRTLSVRVRAREVVLYALDATTIAGTWRLVPDTTAAGGQRLWNPNKSAGKITEPLSNPTNYFEIAFQAETGVAYHLWIRGKADKERRINDSMMVQFSGSVDAAGVATYRIGTTSATAIGLPGCDGCRLSGWGWHDNSANMPAPAIYFEKSGAQTIRVQLQQDGFSIDQIVLSAEKYLTVAPGAARNDKTIVPR
jgi:hypothetical protein